MSQNPHNNRVTKIRGLTVTGSFVAGSFGITSERMQTKEIDAAERATRDANEQAAQRRLTSDEVNMRLVACNRGDVSLRFSSRSTEWMGWRTKMEVSAAVRVW